RDARDPRLLGIAVGEEQRTGRGEWSAYCERPATDAAFGIRPVPFAFEAVNPGAVLPIVADVEPAEDAGNPGIDRPRTVTEMRFALLGPGNGADIKTVPADRMLHLRRRLHRHGFCRDLTRGELVTDPAGPIPAVQIGAAAIIGTHKANPARIGDRGGRANRVLAVGTDIG